MSILYLCASIETRNPHLKASKVKSLTSFKRILTYSFDSHHSGYLHDLRSGIISQEVFNGLCPGHVAHDQIVQMYHHRDVAKIKDLIARYVDRSGLDRGDWVVTTLFHASVAVSAVISEALNIFDKDTSEEGLLGREAHARAVAAFADHYAGYGCPREDVIDLYDALTLRTLVLVRASTIGIVMSMLCGSGFFVRVDEDR